MGLASTRSRSRGQTLHLDTSLRLAAQTGTAAKQRTHLVCTHVRDIRFGSLSITSRSAINSCVNSGCSGGSAGVGSRRRSGTLRSSRKFTYESSWGRSIKSACPRRPMRAVRPTRCTKALGSCAESQHRVSGERCGETRHTSGVCTRRQGVWASIKSRTSRVLFSI